MNLIEQLASLVGFHPSYNDSFGREVFAKDQALRSLLTAMGYDLDDERSLQQSVKQLQEKSWRNPLPPVHIAKFELASHSVEISLAQANSDKLNWQIVTEDGERLSGNFVLGDLDWLDQTELDDQLFVKYRLPLPNLAQGYHRLTLGYGEAQYSCHLIFAPKTCYGPEEAADYKIWGIAAQLYSLHSDNSWGIGDFGDLTQLVKKSAEQGVSAIGLNPLHPLYQNNPAHRSPYSPTSRCFLNTLYIDVTKAPNFAQCATAQVRFNSDEFQQRLQYAQHSKRVDYPAVAALKFEILELLYQDFSTEHLAKKSKLAAQFSQFKQDGDDDLLRLGTFDALYEHFRAIDANAYGWTHWPQAYREVDSAQVKAFQRKYEKRIDYFIFLQWLAHCQLKQASDSAKKLDMPVGLYLDLAVGCDGSGLDVWAAPDLYVSGAAIGAPPDAMNTLGQDWGLTPMNPVALQEQGYQPLVKALRSNMQYAGALRIDHILGLMRQYWVAPGMKADEGVYITFPLEAILRIIALESRRANCVVIGEDLGTVPDGFAEIMQNAGLLSYRVLFFERWQSGLFMRPEQYPAQSMVTVSTHDLPTLAGWWTGRDLEWRQELNLYPNDEMGQADRAGRVGDRKQLIAALEDMQLIEPANGPQQSPALMNRNLTLAVQEFLAKAPSRIQLIPLEDALEIEEQVNIPGTIEQHPNWLQRLPVSIDAMWQSESMTELVAAMKHARPKPGVN